ncbi:hypothetical protein HK096_000298, partial [Nowakowskiella sp. JEL0078]
MLLRTKEVTLARAAGVGDISGDNVDLYRTVCNDLVDDKKAPLLARGQEGSSHATLCGILRTDNSKNVEFLSCIGGGVVICQMMFWQKLEKFVG